MVLTKVGMERHLSQEVATPSRIQIRVHQLGPARKDLLPTQQETGAVGYELPNNLGGLPYLPIVFVAFAEIVESQPSNFVDPVQGIRDGTDRLRTGGELCEILKSTSCFHNFICEEILTP